MFTFWCKIQINFQLYLSRLFGFLVIFFFSGARDWTQGGMLHAKQMLCHWVLSLFLIIAIIYYFIHLSIRYRLCMCSGSSNRSSVTRCDGPSCADWEVESAKFRDFLASCHIASGRARTGILLWFKHRYTCFQILCSHSCTDIFIIWNTRKIHKN